MIHVLTRRPALTLAAFGLAMAGAASMASDAPYAVLPESEYNDGLVINTSYDGNQADSAVAMDAAGDFVFTWSSETGDADQSAGVNARVYTSGGKPLGEPFRVNTHSEGTQFDSDVSMAPDGRFVVVWNSIGQDGDAGGIYAQRYTVDGKRRGTELRVNSVVAGNQSSPSVAVGVDGSFVVTWTSNGQDGALGGIYAQRFSSEGTRLRSEFRVNAERNFDDLAPVVAMDAQNRFVIAWRRVQGDTSIITGRRFAADGSALSPEFAISPAMGALYQAPAIAADAAGDFVVAWGRLDVDPAVPEDYAQSVLAQRYSADGVAQGGVIDVVVSIYTYGTEPAVAMDAAGNFVVALKLYIYPSGAIGKIYYQRFDADGIAQQDLLHVAGGQSNGYLEKSAAVAMDADGDMVIGWDSEDGTRDYDFYGIFANRYTGAEDTDLSLKLGDTTDPVPRDGALAYTAKLSNLHPQSTRTGVAVIDAAIGTATRPALSLKKPVYTSFVQASGDGWSCTEQTSTIDCTRSLPLPAAQSTKLSLQFTAPGVTGTLFTSAKMQADQYDSQAGNNSDSQNTTIEVPSEPRLFDFTDISGVITSAQVGSGKQTMKGIGSSVPVSVSGGKYRINKGEWTKAAGSAIEGDIVELRVNSSKHYSTPVTMQITVGDVTADWTVTTMAEPPPP
ncbi:hypothetical protein [Hydrocarboniphaga sp.]|uniref:hypothetical protein n=1 Tax=Hydrocarboniphaga sp. TaxID=2033016 RepID=UPI003D1297B5